jgi:small subunit ribosomal protein S16
MVRIRLRRVGAKKQPSYRVVAADKESPRDGRFLENLGHYNPRTEPATIVLKEDRIFDWMSKGAQPSDSVMQLFRTAGTLERYERFKAGESLETLMEESEAAQITRTGSPKTSRITTPDNS